MMRKITVLLAGMLVALAVYAAHVQLRVDHPDSYTVRRGDTLWAISARFLAKPWLWPEIWQANAQVRNPHLIYPGDVLNLSLTDGGEGPSLRLEPGVHAEAQAVPAIPLSELQTFLKNVRVVDSSAAKTAPYVVGLEEGRLRSSAGQNIYVRGLRGAPGQRWAIVRPTHIFRRFDQQGSDKGDLVQHQLDSNVAVFKTPWDENTRNDGHYGKGEDRGVEVSVVGTAETLRMGDPSTLLLLNASIDVRSGDRVMPLDDAPYDPYYYPHAPPAVPKDARVIGFADALDAVGPHQVVALSIGKRDGAESGQTYSIYQPGQTVSDDVASNSWSRGVGEQVTLPAEYVGHVMLFRTFDRVSYGLVMDALRPVREGSQLRMPD